MLETFKLQKSDYVKKNFSASDYNKLNLDIYFGLTQEPETNPIQWNDTLKFRAGLGVEEKFVEILKASGIVEKDYNQEIDGRIEVEREGLNVTGYIDAITKEGYPVEIKSINNKNYVGVKKYQEGKPRENYLGQLAVYMDAKGQDKGILLVGSIDGLNVFWFEIEKIRELKYQVKRFKTLDSIKNYGNENKVWKVLNDGWITIEDGTIIDLDKEYKRWDSIDKNIKDGKMPDINQCLYKYNIEEIDWTEISKDKISKARNDKAVIGDWQVQYSRFKDRIIELQGETLGYTSEELLRIKELTKGYSKR